MKQILILILTVMTISCNQAQESNPLLADRTAPFGVPSFESIHNNHYLPAFAKAIKMHNEEIDAIIANASSPNFDNTIAALDYSGKKLSDVVMVFVALLDAETNDSLQAIAKEAMPMMTEHSDNIRLNDKLFQRVKQVYDNQSAANLTGEQTKLLSDTYKDFVRAGALLDETKKQRLREINKESDLLGLQYSENVLKETDNFFLLVESADDLKGLPGGVVAAAADEAKERAMGGKWVFTTKKPSMLPFLQYAEKRELREKLYKGYLMRGDNDNEFDNKKLIDRLVNLSIEKTQLMGFDTPAAFILDNTMAKTSNRVMNLLNTVWGASLPKVKEEAVALQKMIKEEGNSFELQSWDWWYYTEKLRKAKYDLDEEELKPYFKLENVLNGAFEVANRLWGITFNELPNMPIYHPDVKCYEVKDTDGSHLAVFYTDYFPRKGKRPGAWMSNFREQYIENGKETRPIVFNVGNFTKPTGDTPSLLTLDEVETLFHEFGHGLHGMLTRCTYRGVSGTNVARDFVELPSQAMEHWAVHPEVLRLYAKHYQTGEIIPEALIEKMQKAETFNKGFVTTEFVAAAILDMNWYMQNKQEERNVRQFEADAMNAISLISAIAPRYRSSYFLHIFGGGYNAGYYSYLWAEVLDADAFEAFEEKGNIFDQATAEAYRRNVLEKGGSEEPMSLYVKFRGHEPTPDAMLKNRGLK